jgi:D-cysteine desulfhydrase
MNTAQALRKAWNKGLVLDPVYTGKALAGLLDMEHAGNLEIKGPIVFWHTGGMFQALFAGL